MTVLDSTIVNRMENHIIKYIAENGASSPYDLQTKKILEFGKVGHGFMSLHSAGVISPTGEKSEHGGQKFDFTPLGALYMLRRSNFDIKRAKSYWGRIATTQNSAEATNLLNRFETEPGIEESSLRDEMTRMLLYDHENDVTDQHFFGQVDKVYRDHPAMIRFNDNPIIQNAIHRIRPSFVKNDLLGSGLMINPSGIKRETKSKSDTGA